MEKIYFIRTEGAGNLSVCLYFIDNTTQTINIGDYIRSHPHPQYI